MMQLLLLIIPFTLAQFNAESKITIQINRPSNKHGHIIAEYSAVPARFGIPDYNGDRSNDELIDLNEIEAANHKACSPIQADLTEKVVLVDRTDCWFVDKVHHAQARGAAAVIIISESASTPIMSPPGNYNHSEIFIPAVLVSHNQGVEIRELIAEHKENRPGTQPTCSITWDVPKQDGAVAFELFTTANDEESQMFKENFGRIAKVLMESGQLDFSVRYVIYDGTRDFNRHCEEYDQSHDGQQDLRPCGDMCINHGRYCSQDPDRVLTEGISGADDILEEAREMCVWNFTKVEKEDIDIWFDYVARFGDRCLVTEHDSTIDSEENCAREVITSVEEEFKLDTNEMRQYVDKCMKDAGLDHENLQEDLDESNTVLDWEISYRKHVAGVWLSPSYTINGYEMRGSWHCPENANADNCNIFKAICAAYKDGVKPALCSHDWGCPAGKYRDECNYCVLDEPMFNTSIPCDPDSRSYPSAQPTELDVLIEEEGVTKGQATTLIIIGCVLAGLGAGAVLIFYVFKRNERYTFEAQRARDGYLQDVPQDMPDGNVQADSGSYFERAPNGLIEDGAP